MSNRPAEPLPPKMVIDAAKPHDSLWRQLQDLGRRPFLLRVLASRDLKVRYKQSRFGAAWLVLQPLLLLVLFWGFFGIVMRVPSDGLPYLLFAYTGLVAWNQFSQTVAGATASLTAGQALLTKVYFPRLALPLSSAVVGLPDFLIGISLVLLLGAHYGFDPSWRLVLIVPLYLLVLLAALSLGVLAAALNVRYRDVSLMLPFIMQFLLFATPIAYPSSLVPARLLPLFHLNPLSLAVQGLRWAVTGTPHGYTPGLAAAVVAGTAAACILSLAVFARSERRIADLV